MNEKFILSLEWLRAGNAGISFTNGNVNIMVDASYVLYDALADLIETAIYLLNGYDCKKTVFLEPGYISIEAAIQPDGNIELKIGETAIVCPLQRYARQVLKMFDSYYYEHGVDEYEANWRAFPEKQLDTLRRLLRADKMKNN